MSITSGTSSTPLESERAPAAGPAFARRPAGAWLVNPWFDGLFLSNLAWPLLALGLIAWGTDFHGGVSFWQIYFVTTPHRWITLSLVFLDRDRFGERPAAFVAVAAIVVVVCLSVRIGTGALTCLLIVDYFWNAWHFASQHSGILRIYTRRAHPGRTGSARMEKFLLRTFVLYVILRVSGLTWSLLGQRFALLGAADSGWSPAGWEDLLLTADWISLALPALLIFVVRPRLGAIDRGRTLYLASFLSLYLALLAAVHLHRFDLVLVFTLVSALFHATEYLALVTWAMHGRFHSRQQVPRRAAGEAETAEAGPGESSSLPAGRNLMAEIVPHWLLALTLFCVALGLVGWISDLKAVKAWLTINVAVAFLHYWYDGMIWKQRRPRTASTS